MNYLTNSARNVEYLNEEIHNATKHLLDDLKIIQKKFIELCDSNPDLINSYLEYMNFNDEEDMFEIGINKYFEENTEQYNEYKKMF